MPGRIIHIKGRDAEHLARSLAVTAGENRGVYVNEPAFIEKAMDCLCNNAANTENSLESVRAGAQVQNRAQILH